MSPMRNTYFLQILFFFATAISAAAQCALQVDQVTQPTCFGMSNGSISVTPLNGTGPYTFLWSNNDTQEDISGLAAGTYVCTVTDATLCTATVSATVSQPAVLTVTAQTVELTCNLTNTSIPISVSGGTPPYQYLWYNGNTTSNLVVQTPGAYAITVTDIAGCTATTVAIVLQNSNVPIACVLPPSVLTCAQTSVQLSGACSSSGSNIIFQWSTNGGNIVSGGNTLTPTINQPGVYTLLITDVTNGCTAVSSVSVAQDAIIPLVNAGPDLDIPCNGGVLTLIGSGMTGGNFTYEWVGPGIISGGNTLNPIVNQPGIYSVTVTNAVNGCTRSDAMEVHLISTGLCSNITGHVYIDTMENCLTDLGEPPVSGWIVQAVGALGTFYAITDPNGAYDLRVLAGDTYEISAVTPGPAWIPCAPIAAVAVPNPNTTLQAADLLIKKLAGCRQMTVDLISGNLRRCFSNNFFNVSYCNIGTELAEDAYVLVTLDAFLSPVSATLPYTNLGNGVLRFDLGDVPAGTCGSFNFYAHLSCDAALGQTHCTEAHIYPDSSCIQPNVLWSGASLRLTSECTTDSVRFHIENVGIGNMPGAVDYIVIEDQVMLMMGGVQLDASESFEVAFPANGSTWRLEVDQPPFHPGNSSPALSVEGCSTSPTFSTGFVTQFPADDADDYIDIHCLENTGSYDPNDKQAFPRGYGDQHYISPGTPLEYLIRFQNTGNDTAFTVKVIDTLSAWLDPATLRPGASSHPYTWNLEGAGVLSFLFENILLPDSNVNEAASHGFLKFTIRPREDAPLESIIENTAGIYFDFNPAIYTNTTFHRLGENFISVGLWTPIQPNYQVAVVPNPFQTAAYLEVKGMKDTRGLNLQVFDLQGSLRLQKQSDTGIFHLQREGLASGVYLFSLYQGAAHVGQGKLLLRD